ncbi:PPE domain-containing protein [Candidatus Mycolicibacterium alkanivorans]|uniref:PPE family protein n=1 Tax=Candidatus Mycolicibacterium alkanivorans TaxID=2954114 RepID=A0ABS9YSI0_9MYCO|nr:PPE domain-containing protein [Candidatus Mycolicibacterium alkanivorans]MCI4674188.1 PPE family protein [Candidatus Mycolicibacterium alkanivorans]
MPDPAWPCSSPETNYLRLVGPGAAGTASTMANGAAWQALMGSNELAFSLSTLNTAVTSLNFEGVGGLSSATAVTGLNTALQLLAGWAQEKPPIAASAVSAYETAVSSMIPAEVSIANRTEQAADVAINPAVLGALTPAIVALDTEYFGEHWPHNAGAGAAYGAALAALVAALTVPPPISPLGASPAAPATAAAAVAQTAGVTAAGEAMKESGQVTQMAGQTAAAPAKAAGGAGEMSSMMMQPMQAAMGAMQPLMGMFQAPVQAFQGLSGLPQSMMGSLGGMFNGTKAGDAAMPAAELVKVSARGARRRCGRRWWRRGSRWFPRRRADQLHPADEQLCSGELGAPDLAEGRAVERHRPRRPHNPRDGRRRNAGLARARRHAGPRQGGERQRRGGARPHRRGPGSPAGPEAQLRLWSKGVLPSTFARG